MDFASLMAKQISKSGSSSSATTNNPAPPPPTSSTPPSAPSSAAGPKKFISRREAEAAREAAYLAEQAALEAERAARAAAKRQREEDAADEAKAREEKRRRLAEESLLRRQEREAEEERARRKRLGLPELTPPGAGEEGGDAAGDDDDEGDGADVPEEELAARLRAMGEPVALFGEGHVARLKRLRRLTGPVVDNTGPIATTLASVEEKDMKVPDTVPKADDKAGRKWLYRQLASYFNMVLREWEIALAKEGNRDTSAQKAAINAMLSSKETMKPLFRKFEQGVLDESILKAIVEIVKAAQERRYVDANDGYLRLSIGKAAWPIGVTMVGIHERSAREKLHNGERGHVMGDEVTRKFLQSIKRCLTFAQVRWPPEDILQLMG